MKRKARRFPSGKRRRRVGIWIAVGLLISSVTLFAVLLITAPDPPIEELQRAARAVARARDAEAERYAATWYQLAQENLQKAQKLIEEENRRFFLSRSYQAAASAARLAAMEADSALRITLRTKEAMRVDATALLDRARQAAGRFREKVGDLPVNHDYRRQMANAELLVEEAARALERGDYLTALQKAKKAAGDASTAADHVTAELQAYFARQPQWDRWVAETLKEAASKNSYAILVDKLAHTLYLYKGSQRVASYPVDLGTHWLGQKQMRGDNVTPEGRYYVVKKKEGKQTKYYRALVINYPNQEDLDRINQAKRRGELHPRTPAGGLIEIHGEGGKGWDWTNGCVALSNKDMEALYRLVPVGTPVTIVGSISESLLK
ncbi:MAG: L,D-transpeptidase [candidate division KSB1 bacterium]|nr:L,D-transpeptidase [candidate division KSB1 bacterium]